MVPAATVSLVIAAFGLGAASLSLFALFLFVGSFHLVRLEFAPASALAWNATLSLAFFVQHSGMVRHWFRRRLERRVAAPLHGVIYTIASGAVLLLFLVLWQRVGEPLVRLEGAARWILHAVFALALAGIAWGIRALGSFDTFGIKSALASLRGSEPADGPVVVAGPYRWSRHPLYFFVLVLVWCCPVVTADRLLFGVLWTAWIVAGTVLEERDLVARFGDAYVRYQRDVPMIVPWSASGVFGWVVLALIVVFIFLLHYAPFDPASYAAWTGILPFPAALVSIAWPLRFLKIGSRKQATLLLLVSVGLTLAGVLWPTSVVDVRNSAQRLDRFLPRYELREYHETRVQAPMERAVAAVREVSLADMPIAVMLMRLRALAGGATVEEPAARPILELIDQPGSGFMTLDTSDSREVVYGMVGRPWVNEPPPVVRTPEQFLAFDTPGHVRIAFNIRCTDEGDGVVRVSTETRILGNGPSARRIFGRYWRIVYPGSAIIRRVWLDAIAAARAKRAIQGSLPGMLITIGALRWGSYRVRESYGRARTPWTPALEGCSRAVDRYVETQPPEFPTPSGGTPPVERDLPPSH